MIAYDPVAMPNTKRAEAGNKLLSFADQPYDAMKSADALIIATEWAEFRTPDLAKIKSLLKAPVIFDGRNLYEDEILGDLKKQGFHYESIGQAVIN